MRAWRTSNVELSCWTITLARAKKNHNVPLNCHLSGPQCKPYFCSTFTWTARAVYENLKGADALHVQIVQRTKDVAKLGFTWSNTQWEFIEYGIFRFCQLATRTKYNARWSSTRRKQPTQRQSRSAGQYSGKRGRHEYEKRAASTPESVEAMARSIWVSKTMDFSRADNLN